MEYRQDLLKEIENNIEEFSKSHKLVGDYILNHGEKAAYMTANKLASKVGVSESTVVRFANNIGYSGYPEFQRDLQELNKSKLTTIERIDLDDYSDKSQGIKKVFKKDMDNIKKTMEKLDINILEKSVDTILKAERVYIIGLRSSNVLSEYLGFYLRVMLKDVNVINTGTSDIFEQIIKSGPRDVVIGISYPRYSKRTMEALKYVKKQGAKVVGITDRKQSPVAKVADYTLYSDIDMHSFVDSLVAPMSLINALIVWLGIEMKGSITKYFEELENIWKEYDVYNEL